MNQRQQFKFILPSTHILQTQNKYLEISRIYQAEERHSYQLHCILNDILSLHRNTLTTVTHLFNYS